MRQRPRATIRLSTSGEIVESSGNADDVDVLQSIFRALQALSIRSLAELGSGRLKRLILDGTQGRIVLTYDVDGTTSV
ncbi:MAG: hypothetical protein AAF645_11425, partial [Myxococcota bacterium]